MQKFDAPLVLAGGFARFARQLWLRLHARSHRRWRRHGKVAAAAYIRAMSRFYVYEIRENGVAVYVGKDCGDRMHMHGNSGHNRGPLLYRTTKLGRQP